MTTFDRITITKMTTFERIVETYRSRQFVRQMLETVICSLPRKELQVMGWDLRKRGVFTRGWVKLNAKTKVMRNDMMEELPHGLYFLDDCPPHPDPDFGPLLRTTDDPDIAFGASNTVSTWVINSGHAERLLRWTGGWKDGKFEPEIFITDLAKKHGVRIASIAKVPVDLNEEDEDEVALADRCTEDVVVRGSGKRVRAFLQDWMDNHAHVSFFYFGEENEEDSSTFNATFRFHDGVTVCEFFTESSIP